MSEPTLDEVLTWRREANKDVLQIDEPTVKLVIFELSGRLFAFHSEHIREVLAGAEVFFVPGCPSSLEGVINVRGDIEPVIFLHVLLNLDEPTSTCSPILLGRSSAAAGAISTGIRVERVVDVVDVPRGRLQPAPGVLSESLSPFVMGVLELDGKAITLLDIDRLISDYARGLG